MPFYRNVYRTAECGGLVPGTSLHAFIHNGDYHLTDIEVYRDGLIECWGLMTFDEFKRKVDEGWVRVTLPPGARVYAMLGCLTFTASRVVCRINESEFIKEVADELDRLNDRPTSLDRCQKALADYKASPSAERLDAIRIAYEAVPEHNRRFLGDMDTKDSEYRGLLNPPRVRPRSSAHKRGNTLGDA